MPRWQARLRSARSMFLENSARGVQGVDRTTPGVADIKRGTTLDIQLYLNDHLINDPPLGWSSNLELLPSRYPPLG